MPDHIFKATLVLCLLTPLPAAGFLTRDDTGSPEEEKAVHRVLDDLHDAADKADAQRYFGHFTEDGVFMGTDPGERWTLKAFRAWAKPYFERKSAWTFVPRHRNVVLAPEGTVAWFDETAVSEHYGACRGTGVLRKVKGVWKVAHYSLTLPVPNEITRDVVRMIRATKKKTPSIATTVFLVRHAEKEAVDKDPGLTGAGIRRAESLAKVLSGADLKAAYATEFRRTRDTVAPAARAAGVTPTVVAAMDDAALAKKLLADHAGQNVLVAGHSNTIPAILKALGVEKAVELGHDDYDDLFVVVLEPGRRPHLISLKY